MKKNYIRFVTAFLGLAALGAAARGQVSDQLVVNIPYEFVAAGKTLPAGTYRVNRLNAQNNRELIISSFENRAAVLVLSSEVDTARAEQPGVSFQHVGDQHFLSKIETAEHVFTIPVSRSAVLETATRDHSNPSVGASGTSGSN